jgi:hypothetical protein
MEKAAGAIAAPVTLPTHFSCDLWESLEIHFAG